MRRSLGPIAVLLSALVIVGVLAVIAAVPPSDDGNPSSRSAGKLGTLALYSWLGRLGLDVTRLAGNFQLGDADVLVEYDPTVDFSAADLDALTTFVRCGGDLILAFDAGTVEQAMPVLRRLLVQIDATAGPGTAVPAQPLDPAERANHVPVGPGFALLEQPPLIPLLRENGEVVAAGVAVGTGRAFLLGDTQPLANDGLRHDDSPYYVLTLVERARGGRIAFDEYHHGEGAGPGGVASIVDGPIGLAALLTTVLAVAFLAISGRRLGRPVGAADAAEVPSALRYVTALGDLFARSRQRGMIAARYADEVKRRIGEITGVEARLDDDHFVAALEGAGNARAREVAALLSRARVLAAGRPDEGALLELARDADSIERAWPAPAQWR